MNLSAVVRQIPGLGWGVLLVFLLEAVVLGLVIGLS